MRHRCSDVPTKDKGQTHNSRTAQRRLCAAYWKWRGSGAGWSRAHRLVASCVADEGCAEMCWPHHAMQACRLESGGPFCWQLCVQTTADEACLL